MLAPKIDGEDFRTRCSNFKMNFVIGGVHMISNALALLVFTTTVWGQSKPVEEGCNTELKETKGFFVKSDGCEVSPKIAELSKKIAICAFAPEERVNAKKNLEVLLPQLCKLWKTKDRIKIGYKSIVQEASALHGNDIVELPGNISGFPSDQEIQAMLSWANSSGSPLDPLKKDFLADFELDKTLYANEVEALLKKFPESTGNATQVETPSCQSLAKELTDSPLGQDFIAWNCSVPERDRLGSLKQGSNFVEIPHAEKYIFLKKIVPEFPKATTGEYVECSRKQNIIPTVFCSVRKSVNSAPGSSKWCLHAKNYDSDIQGKCARERASVEISKKINDQWLCILESMKKANIYRTSPSQKPSLINDAGIKKKVIMFLAKEQNKVKEDMSLVGAKPIDVSSCGSGKSIVKSMSYSLKDFPLHPINERKFFSLTESFYRDAKVQVGFEFKIPEISPIPEPLSCEDSFWNEMVVNFSDSCR